MGYRYTCMYAGFNFFFAKLPDSYRYLYFFHSRLPWLLGRTSRYTGLPPPILSTSLVNCTFSWLLGRTSRYTGLPPPILSTPLVNCTFSLQTFVVIGKEKSIYRFTATYSLYFLSQFFLFRCRLSWLLGRTSRYTSLAPPILSTSLFNCTFSLQTFVVIGKDKSIYRFTATNSLYIPSQLYFFIADFRGYWEGQVDIPVYRHQFSLHP